jgi:hypothetical protein
MPRGEYADAVPIRCMALCLRSDPAFPVWLARKLYRALVKACHRLAGWRWAAGVAPIALWLCAQITFAQLRPPRRLRQLMTWQPWHPPRLSVRSAWPKPIIPNGTSRQRPNRAGTWLVAHTVRANGVRSGSGVARGSVQALGGTFEAAIPLDI